jgi:hypothetical protein
MSPEENEVQETEQTGDTEETQEVVEVETPETEEVTTPVTDETGETETTEKPEVKVEPIVKPEKEPVKEPEVDHKQKRIDKLTAEKHEARAELEATKARVAQLEAKKQEKVYSEADLAQAERKAIEESNLSLLADIQKERIKNVRRELVEQYQEDKIATTQQVTAKQREWITVVDRYGPDSIPPQYKNNPDFNILDSNSKLYKASEAMYLDPELKQEYAGPGGMVRAVADAFLEMIKIGDGRKTKTPSEKKLERKLAKEKLKSSLSDAGVKETPKGKAKKPVSAFDDYLADRERLKFAPAPKSSNN